MTLQHLVCVLREKIAGALRGLNGASSSRCLHLPLPYAHTTARARAWSMCDRCVHSMTRSSLTHTDGAAPPPRDLLLFKTWLYQLAAGVTIRCVNWFYINPSLMGCPFRYSESRVSARNFNYIVRLKDRFEAFHKRM